MYAATGSEQFKQKGDSLVNGLAEVQTALGNGYLSAYRGSVVSIKDLGDVKDKALETMDASSLSLIHI